MTLSKTLLASLIAGLAFEAAAVDIAPRLGVSANRYDTQVANGTCASIGLSAGATISTPAVFGDVSIEALPMSVRSPSNVGLTRNMVDGWRTEASVTVGVPVWNSLSIIGGYRGVSYGTDAAKSNAATMSGAFIGVSLANLRMTERDIFSISFALQPTDYKAKSGTYGTESDIGTSIRLGYRRAGSPHTFGIRYQSFGGDRSYDEYITTLQYSYLF